MSADEKAAAILVDGRLTVMVRLGDHIVARCVGSTGTYALGFDEERASWYCACPAFASFHRTCSHLRALQLVTVPPTEENRKP